MGFDAGFNMGRQIGQQRIENERQAKLDARQAELDKRADEKYNREQGAWTDTPDVERRTPTRGMPPIDPERFQAGTGLIPKQQGFTPPDDGLGTVDTTLPRFSGLMVGLAGGPTAAPALKVDAGLPEAPPKWKAAIDERYNIAADAARRAKAFQNPAAYDAAMGQIRTIKEDEVLAGRRSEFHGGDDQIGDAASHLNLNSQRLSLGGADKDGRRMLSVVKPDGKAEFLKLSRQDQQTLYAASGLLDTNPERAIQMMASVNKDMAAAVAADNGLTNMVTKTNNDTIDQRKRDENDAARTAVLGRAYTAKEPKQLAPEMVKKLNDMAVALSKETDPVKRQRMMQDYRAQESAAMSSIGKVVGLPESKTSFDMPFKDFMETFGEQVVAQKDGKTVLLKDLPIQQIRSEFMKFRDGNDSGSQLDPRGIAAILGGDPSAAATKPPAKGGLRLNYGPIGDAVKAGGARIGEFVDTLPRGDYPGREADEKAAFGL